MNKLSLWPRLLWTAFPIRHAWKTPPLINYGPVRKQIYNITKILPLHHGNQTVHQPINCTDTCRVVSHVVPPLRFCALGSGVAFLWLNSGWENKALVFQLLNPLRLIGLAKLSLTRGPMAFSRYCQQNYVTTSPTLISTLTCASQIQFTHIHFPSISLPTHLVIINPFTRVWETSAKVSLCRQIQCDKPLSAR